MKCLMFITITARAKARSGDGEYILCDVRERRVGFLENTARRHRRGGRSEVTVTSEPYTEKDEERRHRIDVMMM